MTLSKMFEHFVSENRTPERCSVSKPNREAAARQNFATGKFLVGADSRWGHKLLLTFYIFVIYS